MEIRLTEKKHQFFKKINRWRFSFDEMWSFLNTIHKQFQYENLNSY